LHPGRPGTDLLDLENITGNDLGGPNLLQSAITENGGLESYSMSTSAFVRAVSRIRRRGERTKSFLQLVDDGTGLEFLDETDEGVEQQKRADDTEIDPWTVLSVFVHQKSPSRTSNGEEGNRTVLNRDIS
jgi:hypothetical protein